jgi:hypothetical protein
MCTVTGVVWCAVMSNIADPLQVAPVVVESVTVYPVPTGMGPMVAVIVVLLVTSKEPVLVKLPGPVIE